MRVGLAAQRSDLLTDPNGSSAEQSLDWVQNNGNTYTRSVHGRRAADLVRVLRHRVRHVPAVGSAGASIRATAASSPTAARGTGSNFGYTLPGSDVEFYTLNYDYLQFVPSGAVAHGAEQLRARLRLRHRRHDVDSAVPPFLRAAARIACAASGRAARAEGHLRQPLRRQPEADEPVRAAAADAGEMPQFSARFSLFFDAGNVFSTDHVTFYDRDRRDPRRLRFQHDDLKYSTGVAVQWLAPLGVFRFSYAVPAQRREGHACSITATRRKNFQFSIGQAF